MLYLLITSLVTIEIWVSCQLTDAVFVYDCLCVFVVVYSVGNVFSDHNSIVNCKLQTFPFVGFNSFRFFQNNLCSHQARFLCTNLL